MCFQYPSLFEGIDVSRRLSTAFIHQALSHSHASQSDILKGDRMTILASEPPLFFSLIEFTSIMTEQFLSSTTKHDCTVTISNTHTTQIKSYIDALWIALTTNGSRPPLIRIPMTKTRFLANMLQTHFPPPNNVQQEERQESCNCTNHTPRSSSQAKEEKEFVHSRTRELLETCPLKFKE